MATPNLNGRMNNEIRDATTRALVRQCGSAPRRVLDVGCSYGTLADVLSPDGLECYVGIDLSDFVVEQARRAWADRPVDARFLATDLRAYEPDPDGLPFDAIVFNEVLYYLEVDEAVEEVRRAMAWLAPDGIVCVNMKDDPKCHAIYDGLSEAFRWCYGTIYQQRPDGPRYTLTISRTSPAYLAGVLRPREEAA
jgi:SAM-dependent methyltransferase